MNKQIKNAMLPLLLAIVALVAFKLALDEWYVATEYEDFGPLAEKARLDCEHMPLHCAVRDGDVAALQARLDKGVDLEIRDNNGNTALMLAVKHGQTALAENLLAAGSRPDTQDASGESLLFHVLDSDRFALAEKLLQAGADIDALSTTAYPATVLHYCVMKNRTECVRFLLQHGARRDIEDSFGYTVMERLVAYPHINAEIRRLLQEKEDRR